MIFDETGLIAQLVANLGNIHDRRVLAGSLRAIGNIVTGDDDQTAIVIGENVISALERLVQAEGGQIRREAAWTLSNIAAGPSEHIDLMFGGYNDSMLDTLIDTIHSADRRTRKEVGWTLANAITGCTPNRIRWFSTRGTLNAFYRILLMDDRDERLIGSMLHAIEMMINATPTLIISFRYRIDVINRLQQMTMNGGLAVRLRARNLLEKVSTDYNAVDCNNKCIIYQLQRDM